MAKTRVSRGTNILSEACWSISNYSLTSGNWSTRASMHIGPADRTREICCVRSSALRAICQKNWTWWSISHFQQSNWRYIASSWKLWVARRRSSASESTPWRVQNWFSSSSICCGWFTKRLCPLLKTTKKTAVSGISSTVFLAASSRTRNQRLSPINYWWQNLNKACRSLKDFSEYSSRHI